MWFVNLHVACYPILHVYFQVEKFIRKPRRIVKRRLPLSPKDQNISSSGPTEDEIQSVPTNDEAVDIAHILLSLNKQVSKNLCTYINQGFHLVCE